ncbi:VanZ family protein [Arthrobacter sp. JZ12]|uniref:VanZ family protein n=1 Tax=Arthrobacter sp. JZ12 TaxID=2654190 RepID=UPI002B48B673|nr:VanZ family protein [Arthrobacter sp. JZ12]
MTAGLQKPARRRRLLAALLASYLLALALIGFWPSPVDEGASGLIDRVLRFLHRNGASSWFDYSTIESGANVLLFIPFGFLVAALLPLQRAWLALPIGIIASMCIEVGQEVFRPERVATPRDVLANALGAVIGTVAVYMMSLCNRCVASEYDQPVKRALR